MKKLLLLFFALLMGVSGAWAQTAVLVGQQVTSSAGLVSGNAYLIRATDGTYTTYITDKGTYYEAPQSNVSPTTENVFYIYSDGTSWKLKNAHTGKYWNQPTNENNKSNTSSFNPVAEGSAASYQLTFSGSNIIAKSGDYYINRSSGIMHGWKASGLSLMFYEVANAEIPSTKFVSAVNSTSATTFSDDAYYALQWNTNSPKQFSYFNGTKVIVEQPGITTTDGVVSAADNYKYVFRLKSKGGSIYEMVFYDGTYLKAPSASGDELTKTAYEYQAAQLKLTAGDDAFNLSTTVNGTTYCINRKSYLSGIMAWYTTGAKTITVYPVTLSDYVNVTFQIVDGSGTVMASTTASLRDGTETTTSNIPASLKRGYCNYEMVSGSTTVSSGATIKARYTYSDGPFNFSTVENPVYYLLTTSYNTYVYKNNEDALSVAGTSSVSDTYKWAFIGNPYDFTIRNAAKGMDYYLTCDVSGLSSNGDRANLVLATTGIGHFGLYKNTSGSTGNYTGMLKDVGAPSYCCIDVPSTGSGYSINIYYSNAITTNSDGFINNMGTAFVYAAEAADAYEVTYNIKVGDDIVDYGTKAYTEENVAASLPIGMIKDGCTYTYSPTEVNSSTDHVDVTFTYNPTFVTLTTNSESPQYILLALNDKYYIGYDATDETANVINTTAVDKTDAKFHWYVMGNPYTGLSIYNEAAGPTKVLSSADPTDNLSTTYAVMATENDATHTLHKWYPTKTDSKFYLATDVPEYMMASDGHVIFYASTGASTTFTATDLDYAALIASDFGTYFTTNVGSYFALSQETYNQYNSSYTTFISSSATAANYNTIKAAVASGIRYPETGYYRIKNPNRSNRYLGATTATPSTIDDAASASTVVKLTTTDGGTTYKISMQGKELGTPTHNTTMSLVAIGSGASFTPEISSMAFVGFKNGGNYVHAGASGWNPSYGILGYDQNPSQDEASGWTVTDAPTVTIPLNVVNGKSYATMFLPFDVTLPSGTTAYTVSINDTRAQLNEIAANEGVTTIHSGVPVLLVNESGAGSVVATITSGVDEFNGTNALDGTYVDKTTLAANEYIFGTSNGELGFWKMNSGNKVGANKAFLVYDGIPSSVKGFAIDFDNVDGISSIDNGQLRMDNAPIYNLAGQRVAKAQKGLYIVNGKKVLVK